MESKLKQEPASGTNRPAHNNYRGSSTKPSDRTATERDKSEGGGEMGSSENMSESKKSSEGGKVKRIAACDVCRLRKVKCVKEDGATRCQGCTDLNRDCSYTYTHKRPGPPNPYARATANQDTRYNPYPMPNGNHSGHSRQGYHVDQSRSPRAASNGVPYMPYQDPTYNDSYTGESNTVPLPSLGGYNSFDGNQPPHLPGQKFSQTADPNIPFNAHNSPTNSISPFSSHNHNHNNPNGQMQQQYREIRQAPDPSMLNPPPIGSRPPSHQGHPPQATGNTPNFLSGYSAEDNWFMPWICSTPGADGQIQPDPNAGIASGSGGYPLTGPGTGSTHASSAVLPDMGGNRSGHWSEMELDIGSGRHPHRPPVDDNLDPRLGGPRRTGTYQTSGMRSRPNSPPAGGPSGFDVGAGAYAGPTQTSALKRASTTTSAGGTAGETPGATYPTAQVEDITRWSTALTFLNLYHEHLYPLLPLMHWPTFSQHLVSRRDRHDETFRVFLMSLIAYAILQLPRSVMPGFIKQEELVKLHRRLHHTSRAMQKREYEPLELLHISTLYVDHIYLGSTGKDNYANVVLAEAMRLAITLGLHDENIAIQQGLDAIEKETRRRVFWVLYGSDRTIAALISCPMLLSDEDIFVSDILQVDDDLITTAGAFQQPLGKTPLLCGFMHVTRIFRLLSQVLRLVRARAHGQPTPEDQPDTSPDPRELIKSLQMLLDDLPPPLRLNPEQVDPRDLANTYAFDTCKANILVTQVLVRFAIYQYATLRAQGRPDQCLDELTEDVLKRLHQMSSESLAANGESIRHKVLFIASSLLNKYPAQDSAGHEHVADFLQVYNKILTNQTKSNLDEDDLEGEDGQRGSHP